MVFPENNNIGYAVDADRILKTTNKGVSWFPVRNDADSYFTHLDATDNNNVFAYSTYTSGVNSNSKLLRTINAGSSWIQSNLPAGSGGTIGAADFITPNKGWINIADGNGNAGMFYTSDAGAHWAQKNNPATPFITSSFQFINDSTGLALAGSFEIYKTTDSGKIWEPVSRDNNFTYLGYSFNDLQVLNATQLWGSWFLRNQYQCRRPYPATCTIWH
jgi:photosystem II stability/assembly factor-like uncharacterized protein